ncbi:hypothetical protein [Psychrobacillus antarcticus]|uniref:hypothetical protein n=1 Tax=Psychrobacillus antarcticus TaxID=2879115 RepID=UPI0024080537|nr:hypothetical protein [Psychrobacillus antarcticus]
MNKNKTNFKDKYPDLLTNSQSILPAVIADLMIPLAHALAAMAEVLTTVGAQQEQSNTAENKKLQKLLEFLNYEIENFKKQFNYHND